MFGGAALSAWLALLLLWLALGWLLDEELNTALSFPIVGVLWAVAAFILQRSAGWSLERLRGLPQTRQTIKEDVEWANTRRAEAKHRDDTREPRRDGREGRGDR